MRGGTVGTRGPTVCPWPRCSVRAVRTSLGPLAVAAPSVLSRWRRLAAVSGAALGGLSVRGHSEGWIGVLGVVRGGGVPGADAFRAGPLAGWMRDRGVGGDPKEPLGVWAGDFGLMPAGIIAVSTARLGGSAEGGPGAG